MVVRADARPCRHAHSECNTLAPLDLTLSQTSTVSGDSSASGMSNVIAVQEVSASAPPKFCRKQTTFQFPEQQLRCRYRNVYASRRSLPAHLIGRYRHVLTRRASRNNFRQQPEVTSCNEDITSRGDTTASYSTKVECPEIYGNNNLTTVHAQVTSTKAELNINNHHDQSTVSKVEGTKYDEAAPNTFNGVEVWSNLDDKSDLTVKPDSATGALDKHSNNGDIAINEIAPGGCNDCRVLSPSPPTSERHTRRRYPNSPHPSPGQLRISLFSRLSTEARCALDETRREMELLVPPETKMTSPTFSGGLPLPASQSNESVHTRASAIGIETGIVNARTEHGIHALSRASTDPSADTIRKEKLQSSINGESSMYTQILPLTPKGKHISKCKSAATQRVKPTPRKSLWTQNIQAAENQQRKCNKFARNSDGTDAIDFATNAKLQRLSLRQRTQLDLEVTDREASFHITPPWYDSRYTPIDTLEQEVRDSMPEIIRTEAVKKCTDWLNKYML